MYSLPIPLLFVLTVITTSLNSILLGAFSKKQQMSMSLVWLYNSLSNISCLIAMGIIFLVSRTQVDFTFSSFSVLLGIFLGIANILSVSGNLNAISVGPFSYTTVIVSLSAIIPAFSGLIIFGEKITVTQCIGIIFMVVCVILSQDRNEEKSKKSISTKWLLYCALAFFASGSLGVVQKIHQNNSACKNQMPALLLSAFLVSAIFSFFRFSILKKSVDKAVAPAQSKKIYLMPIASGICLAFPHTVNLFLSGKMPSMIFFPIVNLTPMIFVMLFAIVVMHERLSIKRWIGIGFGILSTILFSGIINI